MTLNPPNAISILHGYRALQNRSMPRLGLVLHLNILLCRHLEPAQRPYQRFLEFYHLHLQAIPFDLAKEAWGISQVSPPVLPSPPTGPAKSEPNP